MNNQRHIIALTRRDLVLATVLLAAVVGIIGCGNIARASRIRGASERYSERSSSSSCPKETNAAAVLGVEDGVPGGQPILAGPIFVGCGVRMGEPVRFLAYVQATGHGGEQLCYVLNQPRQKALTGGSCLQIAPSLPQCRRGCPLTIVEARVRKALGNRPGKASLVTGAAAGIMEEVVLATKPLRDQTMVSPFIVVLKGSVRKELRLSSSVSLFASFVTPCLPAGQMVEATGTLSGGEEFAMQGSDPFSCPG